MPACPTPAQSAASVANGALSKGPATEVGKAASSGNAVRHGLAGKRITLDDHEAARLEALRQDHHGRRRPVGALEEAAIAVMALAVIKLDRADAMEALVCDAIARQEADAWPTLGTVLRYRARTAREQRDAAAELDRLQHAPRVAVAREAAVVTTKPRTNEPELRVVPAPERRAAAVAEPARALNRHQRRRLEAVERKRAAMG